MRGLRVQISVPESDIPDAIHVTLRTKKGAVRGSGVMPLLEDPSRMFTVPSSNFWWSEDGIREAPLTSDEMHLIAEAAKKLGAVPYLHG